VKELKVGQMSVIVDPVLSAVESGEGIESQVVSLVKLPLQLLWNPVKELKEINPPQPRPPLNNRRGIR